ncbi:FAD/NAD(P)-binding protein [Yoonia sp. MH D7]
MTRHTKDRRIAIVGFGPRGLGALEALGTASTQKLTKITIDIFDPQHHLGAGPNFAPDQSPLSLLNIPVRALDIDPPAFLSGKIGTFADWSAHDYHRAAILARISPPAPKWCAIRCQIISAPPTCNTP